MNTEILFPQLGFSMDEGKLAEWLVADGAEIKEGEPLYTLESDKSTMEIESPATGRLQIGVQAGEVCQVGAVLGKIV
jgi:pyruvate/2-oxoglutarate dehydrogenase complex dihydrolipoamide acyltransferase (E2) component